MGEGTDVSPVPGEQKHMWRFLKGKQQGKSKAKILKKEARALF